MSGGEHDPTTLRPDWVEVERLQPGVWRELIRLRRRAFSRWPRTVGLTLALTALVLLFAGTRPRAYASRVAFRVTEGGADSAAGPSTNGKLREYVQQVVFSNQRLQAVIKEHGLYPSLAMRDISLAVESMRDDIEVEVWRNYFGAPRSADDPTRSARIAITFHAVKAQVAYDVTRELGKLITEHERGSRLQQAEAALRQADAEADSARELLAHRKRDLVEKELQREAARTPAEGLLRMVEIRNLEKAIPRANRLADAAERKRQQAYMRLQLEKHALGLRWEMIDPGRIEPQGMSRALQLTILAIVLVLLTLPLCVVAVGAFDSRVYDLDDLRRLGLIPVGAVRHFGGDNVGALVERLRDDPRARMDAS